MLISLNPERPRREDSYLLSEPPAARKVLSGWLAPLAAPTVNG
jgi:hypothetical protein